MDAEEKDGEAGFDDAHDCELLAEPPDDGGEPGHKARRAPWGPRPGGRPAPADRPRSPSYARRLHELVVNNPRPDRKPRMVIGRARSGPRTRSSSKRE